ncbi:histidine kinase [Salinibacterium sp. dk2585]|uniref:sensor histidine kinase n=1 Tax=unclassified Salinibacterium TaxID=2632331 RepID=UPI0011C254EF|nr:MULTISPECIES: histidine kinase [unclassified Salinibacterium]QEE61688.1 histidine kinase [Salinibacterium sp. dk2585]TXK54760.1 histidine kinase [Salinibacterium sp. dk5596]
MRSAESPPARSVHTTWLYTLGSIVFFFVILQGDVIVVSLQAVGTARTAGDLPWLLLSIGVMALALVSAGMQIRYSWFLRAGLAGGLPRPPRTMLLWVPPALIWPLGLFLPELTLHAALPLWMSVNLVAPLLRPLERWALIGGGALLTVAHPVLAWLVFGHSFALAEGPGSFLIFSYGALLPVMVLTALWWWQVVVELDRHRRASAELAVARERLRFASDLHDIQGHHLQVIALKAELAERLLDAEPETAREHIHETRMIARRALEDTRSLVYGYRDVALTVELENAREVLTASGAQCDLDVGAQPLDPEAQRALAMVVREATTNILRHSSASTVWIRLRDVAGGTELLIGNNGADAAASGQGNGLTGLRERLAAVGGQLDVDARPAAGEFELRALVRAMEMAE